MSTNNSWNNAISAANSAITLNAGTNAINISSDAAATTVNLATGAGVKSVTVGSTNTTSALTLNSGSGGIKAVGVASVSVANKNYVTINTSTGALGSDAGPAAGSLVLIETQTTAGAANINFTSGISSTYGTYFIVFRNIGTASSTGNFQMLFSTDGGSSHLGSGYVTGYNSSAYNSAAWGNSNSTSVCLFGSLNTTARYNGFIYIHNLGASIVPSYAGQAWQSNGNQQNILYGVNTGTTAINALRFNTSSPNIVGTISLYGIIN